MSEWIEVCKTSELGDGKMIMTKVGGKQIVLARVGDRYFAADNHCPHLGGNLSAGKLEGTIVTCPRHHSQFDLADGHVVRWTDWSGLMATAAETLRPPRSIIMHEVRIEGDAILIEGW